MQGWTFRVLSSHRAGALAPALPLASHRDLISDVSVPVFVPFSIHAMPVPQGVGACYLHTSPLHGSLAQPAGEDSQVYSQTPSLTTSDIPHPHHSLSSDPAVLFFTAPVI